MKFLNYDAVSPHSVEAAVALVDSDLTESQVAAQCPAGLVFGEYSRHKLEPHHECLGSNDYLHQQYADNLGTREKATGSPQDP